MVKIQTNEFVEDDEGLTSTTLILFAGSIC